ncbi:MAG TPA: GNAT family protein [Candidatus Limnocylindria bacterium]|nr:GNAT family protein [Candidatus Limnocylindria bacterium]
MRLRLKRVFEWNGASARVLEKAGFVREGRLPSHTVKDGTLVDRLVGAAVRSP